MLCTRGETWVQGGLRVYRYWGQHHGCQESFVHKIGERLSAPLARQGHHVVVPVQTRLSHGTASAKADAALHTVLCRGTSLSVKS